MFWKKKKENIWQKLKHQNPEGILVLAPMADVTDNPFRKIITILGAPDIFFTEFVAADGLAHPIARPRLIKQILKFEKKQQPIIAQIFGGKPENFFLAGKICAELGFAGVDINTGCPQKNILKQRAGSELIKMENRKLMKELIKSVRAGIKASGKNIPLSVKTRLGFNEIDWSWLEFLLAEKLDALTIHLRTKKEMSKVPAHFEVVEKIVELKNRISPKTILIINGDILSVAEAQEKVKKYQVDGVMIGRGIFENPALFAEQNFADFSVSKKIKILKQHTKYFDKEFPANREGKRMKNFALLKKFFKIYLNNFEGAKELRNELMQVKDKREIFKICDNFLKKC